MAQTGYGAQRSPALGNASAQSADIVPSTPGKASNTEQLPANDPATSFASSISDARRSIKILRAGLDAVDGGAISIARADLEAALEYARRAVRINEPQQRSAMQVELDAVSRHACFRALSPSRAKRSTFAPHS
jgi:hypothetical protein